MSVVSMTSVNSSMNSYLKIENVVDFFKDINKVALDHESIETRAYFENLDTENKNISRKFKVYPKQEIAKNIPTEFVFFDWGKFIRIKNVLKYYYPILNTFKSKELNKIFYLNRYNQEIVSNQKLSIIFFFYYIACFIQYLLVYLSDEIGKSFWYIFLFYFAPFVITIIPTIFVLITHLYSWNCYSNILISILLFLSYLVAINLVEYFIGIIHMSPLTFGFFNFILAFGVSTWVKIVLILALAISFLINFYLNQSLLMHEGMDFSFASIIMIVALYSYATINSSLVKDLRDAVSFFHIGLDTKIGMLFEEEREKSKKFLSAILPDVVLKKINSDNSFNGKVIGEYYENVSILFADVVEFTKFSSEHTAFDVVDLLHHVFSQFYEKIQKYPLTVLKTIGDNFNCVGGAPIPSRVHAKSMAMFALDVLENLKTVKMRIGIHSGDCVAGIAGTIRFRWDLVGKNVTFAEKIENYGKPSRIHCSKSFAKEYCHKYENGYSFVKRKSEVNIDGEMVTTFWLEKGSEIMVKKEDWLGE